MLYQDNSTEIMESSQVALFTGPTWIVAQACVALSEVTFVYIFARLVRYKRNNSRFGERNASFGKRVGERMYCICIVVAILDILYTTGIQIYLVGSWNSRRLCEIATHVCVFLYSTSVLHTCFFLWWRQRLLYENKLLKHLSSKVTQILSWLSILGVTAATFIPTVSQIVWRKSNLTDEGCIFTKDRRGMYWTWSIVYMTTYNLSEVLLLVLYVRSFVTVWKFNRERTNKKRQSKKSASEAQSKAGFRNCVIRSVLLMAICDIADFVDILLVVISLNRETDRWLMLIPHLFNAATNLICMVCCFSYWKEVLLPCHSILQNEVVVKERVPTPSLKSARAPPSEIV